MPWKPNDLKPGTDSIGLTKIVSIIPIIKTIRVSFFLRKFDFLIIVFIYSLEIFCCDLIVKVLKKIN